MAKEYPKMGATVTFARCDDKGVVTTGYGIVQAIFIDPMKKICVQVKQPQGAYNVDLGMVNYSSEELEAYKKVCAEVAEMTETGNAEVRALVDKLNSSIEEKHKSLFPDCLCDIDAIMQEQEAKFLGDKAAGKAVEAHDKEIVEKCLADDGQEAVESDEKSE